VQTADLYQWFASYEARGKSPCFEAWATGVAEDPEVLAMIDALPPRQRQPNLLFAAARFVGVEPGPFEEFRTAVVERWDEVSDITASRRTQTNEVGRCATLLPALATIPGPLSLIEVGASAGLCLYPDRLAYRYGAGRILAPDTEDEPLLLDCDVNGPVPVPDALPEVVWRAGVDLNPLDVQDPDDVRWLETLVWPEQQHRLARLRAAVEIARADPPNLIAGDLVAALPQLVASASEGSTVVVFHSAVLNYVTPEVRSEFIALVDALGCRWLSNEGPGVIEFSTATLPPSPDPTTGLFTVALDGTPLAYADPHGSSLHWFDHPHGPPPDESGRER
jgi:hypothetical protein